MRALNFSRHAFSDKLITAVLKLQVQPHWLVLGSLLLSASIVSNPAQAQPQQTSQAARQVTTERGIEAVQLYSDDELVSLIRKNEHFARVRDIDDCQLYQDIKAQAEVERRPVYQLLYGDMLAYAVCYERDVKLGIAYMQHAAAQGMPEALEQMGRYYHQGQFVQADHERALLYLREAAALGNLPAQKGFADMLLAGAGSPLDYETAYHFLHNAVTADRTEHHAITKRLHKLAELLPPRIVERAKSPLDA